MVEIKTLVLKPRHNVSIQLEDAHFKILVACAKRNGRSRTREAKLRLEDSLERLMSGYLPKGEGTTNEA